uniref:Uncharacterized protein n=1 Tax=Arundo donax TaxID=35708 RepID=A0A0A9HEU1_ARUDO
MAPQSFQCSSYPNHTRGCTGHLTARRLCSPAGRCACLYPPQMNPVEVMW